MSKEELYKIDDILIKIYNSDLLTGKELNMLAEWINEPRDRIDKAIEYIENNMKEEYVHTDYIHTMIKILRGEDSE